MFSWKKMLTVVAVVSGLTSALVTGCGSDNSGDNTRSSVAPTSQRPVGHHDEEATDWCGRSGAKSPLAIWPSESSGKTGIWPPKSDADAEFVKVGNLEVYVRGRKANPNECERTYWFGTMQTPRTNGHYVIWVEINGVPGKDQRSEPTKQHGELISFTGYGPKDSKVAFCLQETSADGVRLGEVTRIELTSV